MKDVRACEVKGITVRYRRGQPPALEDVDFHANLGEMVLVAGPNGGGKSTLLKSIVGLLKPEKGSIRVLGRDPYRDPGVRRLIGYVPQISDLNLNAPITLWDLVALPRLALRGRPIPFRGLKDEDLKAIEDSIRRLGLEDHADKLVSELSGGMLARAMIARVLALDPKIYILDEPFESMDSESEEIAVKVLVEEKMRGKLVIVAEHHIADASPYDRAVLINRRVLMEGSPGEILEAYRKAAAR